jgi:outer membrane protein OmpA-like peptidoglycan-associated protein
MSQRGGELRVHVGGGLGAFRYDNSLAAPAAGPAGQAGLSFAYYLNDRWAVGVGAGVSHIRPAAFVREQELPTLEPLDNEGDKFTLNTTLYDHLEEQRATYLTIPILAQFTQGAFYAQAGVTVGIPLAGNYSGRSVAGLSTGYYPQWSTPSKIAWVPEQNFSGVGPIRTTAANGSVDLGVAVSASVEVGMVRRLTERWRLYAGVYCDVGLNDVRGGTPPQAYQPDNPTAYQVGSVLHVAQAFGGAAPVGAGLLVRLGFGFNPVKKDGIQAPLAPMRDTVFVRDTLVRVDTVRVAAIQTLRVTDTVRVVAAPQIVRITDTVRVAAAPQTVRVTDTVRVAAPIAPAPAEKPAPSENLLLLRVHFHFGSVLLTEQARAALDKAAKTLAQHPEVNLIVSGHTDSIGVPRYNQPISEKRAKAVVDYLALKGISRGRLASVGQASEAPIAPNATRQGRAQNRRADLNRRP